MVVWLDTLWGLRKSKVNCFCILRNYMLSIYSFQMSKNSNLAISHEYECFKVSSDIDWWHWVFQSTSIWFCDLLNDDDIPLWNVKELTKSHVLLKWAKGAKWNKNVLGEPIDD